MKAPAPSLSLGGGLIYTTLCLHCVRVCLAMLRLHCVRVCITMLCLHCVIVCITMLHLHCVRVCLTMLWLHCVRVCLTMLCLHCVIVCLATLCLHCVRVCLTTLYFRACMTSTAGRRAPSRGSRRCNINSACTITQCKHSNINLLSQPTGQTKRHSPAP
jgi:hypothetical protein